jgi:hypothetical protein
MVYTVKGRGRLRQFPVKNVVDMKICDYHDYNLIK